MPLTVRGTVQCLWKPQYQLSLVSDDGNELPADGQRHRLTATLTRISNDSPVANRKVRLATTPSGRVGHGVVSWTNGQGKAYYPASNTVVETVDYTATLMALGGGLDTGVDAETEILWGGGGDDACYSAVSPTGPEHVVAGEEPGYWYVQVDYSVTTGEGTTFARWLRAIRFDGTEPTAEDIEAVFTEPGRTLDFECEEAGNFNGNEPQWAIQLQADLDGQLAFLNANLCA